MPTGGPPRGPAARTSAGGSRTSIATHGRSRPTIQVARPVFSLRHEREDRAGLIGIGVCRIKGREADGASCSTPTTSRPACATTSHPTLPELPGRARGQAREHRRRPRRLHLEPAGPRLRRVSSDLLVLELVNRAQAAGRASARAGHDASRAPLPFPGRLGRRDGDLRCRGSSAASLPDLPSSGAGHRLPAADRDDPPAARSVSPRSRARPCPCRYRRTRAACGRRPRRPRPSCSRAPPSCSPSVPPWPTSRFAAGFPGSP